MNAQLLNPFTIDIPDSVSATLESAECTTLLFNHGSNTLSGQYLAVGRSDGYITIWDIETKSVLRLLTGHVRPVTGLAWSEGNRYLASGSADWSVIIWDLKAKRYENVEQNRRSKSRKWFPLPLAHLSYPTPLQLKNHPKANHQQPRPLQASPPLVFTPDSRFIVAGTSKGSLLIFSSFTGALLSESKVLSTSSGVKELSFDVAGRFLVVNCNDRSLRLLSLSLTPSDPTPTLTLTLQNKVQDMVQRTAWSTLGFSPSSDYIFAGAAHKASHNIYIWDRPSATLTKILEGPKDWLISVDWHPNRPMLASVGNTGAIYIWFTPTEEIWSAYAPGFEELEENRNYDYEEREDEFDVDEGEGVREMKRQEEVEAGEVRVGAGSGGRRGLWG
ncbi:hypothetical protein NDA17_002531 [Ustilago hordei]|nr:hypothetical protein NDA17_002531 [Ustilago hordei]